MPKPSKASKTQPVDHRIISYVNSMINKANNKILTELANLKNQLAHAQEERGNTQNTKEPQAGNDKAKRSNVNNENPSIKRLRGSNVDISRHVKKFIRTLSDYSTESEDEMDVAKDNIFISNEDGEECKPLEVGETWVEETNEGDETEEALGIPAEIGAKLKKWPIYDGAIVGGKYHHQRTEIAEYAESGNKESLIDSTKTKAKEGKRTNEGGSTGNKRKSKQEQESTRADTIKIKVPPIIAEKGLNTMKLAKMLIKEDEIKDFQIKILANKQKVIKCNDMESHKIICDKLKRHMVGGHTYTPKHEKPRVYLVKGIHKGYENEEVQKELEEEFGLIAKVSKFSTPKMTREGREMDAKVVSVEGKTSINEILKIKWLFNHAIEWQHLKKKEIIQCMNCLRYGHVAKNCLNRFRCLKCDEDHERGNCKKFMCDTCKVDHGKEECKASTSEESTEKKANNRESMYCVNCRKTGHPANYKGCPAYAAIIENKNKNRNNKLMINQKKMEAKAIARESIHNLVQKNISFASIVKGKETIASPTSNKREGLAFLQEESSNLFGTSLIDTMKKVNEFMGNYKIIQEREEKQVAFITFLMGICR